MIETPGKRQDAIIRAWRLAIAAAPEGLTEHQQAALEAEASYHVAHPGHVLSDRERRAVWPLYPAEAADLEQRLEAAGWQRPDPGG